MELTVPIRIKGTRIDSTGSVSRLTLRIFCPLNFRLSAPSTEYSRCCRASPVPLNAGTLCCPETARLPRKSPSTPPPRLVSDPSQAPVPVSFARGQKEFFPGRFTVGLSRGRRVGGCEPGAVGGRRQRPPQPHPSPLPTYTPPRTPTPPLPVF